MLGKLGSISKTRAPWILMAITVLLLECTALFFQHVMELKPCVLCIYERCALFGILAAALIGMISPSTPLRFVAMIVWVISAWKGIDLTYGHVMLQLYPSPFHTCALFVEFPHWLPLNQWMPAIFEASGDCAERQWAFLSLEMPQWLLIIFIAYLIVALAVIMSQFFPNKSDNYN